MIHESIIRDPSKGKQSEKTIVDGIIKSSALSPFQREALDGILRSGQPQKKPKSEPKLMKTSAPKTKQPIGHIHFPGSKYT
jgi:hypothetical protein